MVETLSLSPHPAIMAEVADSGPVEPQARHIVYCGGEYPPGYPVWRTRLTVTPRSVYSTPRGMSFPGFNFPLPTSASLTHAWIQSL